MLILSVPGIIFFVIVIVVVMSAVSDYLRTFMGHNAPISSLSWSAEGLLLSGSWDETARGWDLETSECKWVLGGHEVRGLSY